MQKIILVIIMFFVCTGLAFGEINDELGAIFDKIDNGDVAVIDEVLKKAQAGDVESQFSMGLLYSLGKGVPKSYPEAYKWLSKAAEQGHTDAQATLGEMYYFGQGIPQNYKEAYKNDLIIDMIHTRLFCPIDESELLKDNIIDIWNALLPEIEYDTYKSSYLYINFT